VIINAAIFFIGVVPSAPVIGACSETSFSWHSFEHAAIFASLQKRKIASKIRLKQVSEHALGFFLLFVLYACTIANDIDGREANSQTANSQ